LRGTRDDFLTAMVVSLVLDFEPLFFGPLTPSAMVFDPIDFLLKAETSGWIWDGTKGWTWWGWIIASSKKSWPLSKLGWICWKKY